MTSPTPPNTEGNADRELDDISTYRGLLDAIHKFAERLARQAEDLDKQVKSFNILPQSRHDILASTIENFIYTVVKIKENQFRAGERDRIKQSNRELLERILEAGPKDWLADPKYRNLAGTEHSTDYFKARGHDLCNDQWRTTIDNIAKEIRGEG